MCRCYGRYQIKKSKEETMSETMMTLIVGVIAFSASLGVMYKSFYIDRE